MPSRKDYWYCTSYLNGKLAHKIGVFTLCHSIDPNVESETLHWALCHVAKEEKCLEMDLAIYYRKHFCLSRVF